MDQEGFTEYINQEEEKKLEGEREEAWKIKGTYAERKAKISNKELRGEACWSKIRESKKREKKCGSTSLSNDIMITKKNKSPKAVKKTDKKKLGKFINLVIYVNS